MLQRWLGTIGLVGAMCLPAWAQGNGAPAQGPTAAQQARLQAVLAMKAKALSSNPPDNDLLKGSLVAFQTELVAFWERTDDGKIITRIKGPFFAHADANYHFAEAAMLYVPGNATPYLVYEWSAALKSSERCVTLNKNHKDGWLLYGKVRAHRWNGHNYAAALPGFTYDLILNPKRLESHQWKAVCHLQLGQTDKALAAVAAGLVHHPKASKLHELRAAALTSLRQYAQAQAAYGVAANLDPSNHGLIDRWVESDKQAQNAAGKRPMPHAALQWLLNFEKRHPAHWKAGEKYAEISLGIWRSMNPNAPQKAQAWANQGLAKLSGLEQRFPNDLRGGQWVIWEADVFRASKQYVNLGQVVARGIKRVAGDFKQVGDIMKQLGNAAGTRNLFDEYRNKAQWAQCLALADLLLTVLPGTDDRENKRRGVVHQVRFECLQPLRRLGDAAKAIQAAAEAHPSNAKYRNSHGLLLRYLGKNEEAIGEFRAALRIQEGQEWASTNLVTLLMQMGRWDVFNVEITKAMGHASDRFIGAQEELQGLLDDGEPKAKIDEAREALEYERFHTANLRRLYIEGLRLQRAEKKQ